VAAQWTATLAAEVVAVETEPGDDDQHRKGDETGHAGIRRRRRRAKPDITEGTAHRRGVAAQIARRCIARCADVNQRLAKVPREIRLRAGIELARSQREGEETNAA
jgi:hypothetical protein